jgi:rod shape-determining protein MreB
MLSGLDRLISQETEVPVHVTEQPLESVVMGAGKCLESFDQARSIFLESSRRA